jgi:hypothetical protein
MKLFLNQGAPMLSKAAFAAAVLGGFLLFAGAQHAKANDRDDDDRRVGYSDWRLDRHEASERAERRRERERREHRREFIERYRRR